MAVDIDVAVAGKMFRGDQHARSRDPNARLG